MVTVAKATTLPRTRVRSVIAGASYFALFLIVIGFSAFAILHILHATFTSSDEAASILAAREISKHGIPFVPSGQIYYRSPVAHYLAGLSILMIGDSELGWRGASLTAYCLLLLLPALILMRRGPTILGPAWALFVGLSPAILLSAFSARMYMVYMLFCTLAIVLSVFWRPMKWDRKVLLYLLTSLAASFSNERFIVFAPAILLSSLMAQWSLLGREPLLDFLVSPQFVTPVSAIGCALIHFVDPFLPLSFLNETSTPVSLGLAQSWSYPIDVLALTPVPPLLMLTAIIGFSARHRGLKNPPFGHIGVNLPGIDIHAIHSPGTNDRYPRTASARRLR